MLSSQIFHGAVEERLESSGLEIFGSQGEELRMASVTFFPVLRRCIGIGPIITQRNIAFSAAFRDWVALTRGSAVPRARAMREECMVRDVSCKLFESPNSRIECGKRARSGGVLDVREARREEREQVQRGGKSTRYVEWGGAG